MNRLSALAGLALVSALATPVVVSATAIAPSDRAVQVQQAALPTVEPAAQAAEAPCTRRVRVVYPGAGVTNGIACAPAPVELRR